MHKDPRFPVTDGTGDLLRGEGGRQRQVAAGERLAKAHDVGADPCPVAGKQLAGAAKASGDLVGDEQQAELVAQGAHPLQVAGMIETHAACPLHDGFEHDGGYLFVAIGNQLRQLYDAALVPLGVEATAGRFDKMVLGQEALVELVHAAIRIADAHGAEGVTVIAAPQGDELGAGRSPGVPVLLGHLECHLHRHRPRICQKDPIQPGRGDLHQLATQRHRRGMGQPAKHHVGHLAELGSRRCVQFRHLITVDAGPPGAHAIHQFTAVAEGEGHPLGAGHFIAGQGMVEGGVGVPDVVQVEFLIGHFVFCCQLI
ncbi:hypothetical protein D3C81_488390 [compost metagenome]